MVEKLGLQRTKHPRPYRLKWLNDETELKISEQVTIAFSIGKYADQVVCDVVPMQAGYLLLGGLGNSIRTPYIAAEQTTIASLTTTRSTI